MYGSTPPPGDGDGAVSKMFWPFGPQFDLKIRGQSAPPTGLLPWIRQCKRTSVTYKNNQQTMMADCILWLAPNLPHTFLKALD